MKADDNEDLYDLLKGAGLHREKAPARLRLRIANDLAIRRPAQRPGLMMALLQMLRFRWRYFGVGMLAGAAALQLMVFIWPLQSTSDDALDKEIVANHVHSLLADHLLDIASSDPRTVQHWFLGKLDHSPAVRDLSDKGFPLVGGRLDYVDGHPAAALVYSRGQQVINLFTWPVADTGIQARRPPSHPRFSMVEWNHAGMRFWAVSDISPSELELFARAAAP